MKLIQSLEEYHNGSLTREELLHGLEGEHKNELDDLTVVSEALSQISQWNDFPEDVTDLLKTRLAEASATPKDIASQPYRGSDAFAFISYCESDTQRVYSEISRLDELGYNCYFDTADHSASMVSDEFAGRLLDAQVFVFFVSAESIESHRCRRELSLALDSDKRIIAAHLEDIELPPGLRLSLANQVSVSLFRLTREDIQRQFVSAFERSGLEPRPEPDEADDDTQVATTTPQTLEPGALLNGRFLLEKRLGSGGMSVVYKATDTKAYGEPHVAIKVLNPEFAQHPDSTLTLKRETAKTRQLAHPNVVNVGDFGEDGPHVFMWMDFLDGESLSERLGGQAEGLDPEEAGIILEGIVDGLSFAHGQNMVHADFKPGNVMLAGGKVTEKLQVKIIDFGIARAVRNAEMTSLDEEKTVYDVKKLGAYTEAYATIELIENQNADPSDDVYALGCIAYEMFTGAHPFGKKGADYASRKDLQVEQHPRLSRNQFRAIRNALSFDRARRTPSVRQFFDEFTAGGATTSARPGFDTKKMLMGLAAVVALGVGYLVYQTVSLTPSSTPNTIGANFSDCSGCPEMVIIGAGQFDQGGGALTSQLPIRTVTLPRNFAASVHEVTVDEFDAFVEDEGFSGDACQIWEGGTWRSSSDHSWEDPGFEQAGNHPVTCVSWDDAVAYTEWLSDASGETYRLLSASEWEYLAQRTHNRESLCEVANIADQKALESFPGWTVSPCNDESVFTSATGRYGRNQIGVSDLLGNVFEWTQDCWQADYLLAPVDGSPHAASTCQHREARGGSWFTQPEFVHARFRNRLPADTRSSSVGFRVARDL